MQYFNFPNGVGIAQTVAPTATLISLSELKAHLGIEYTNDDVRLTALLSASRDLIEKECDLCVTAQTWTQTMPRFLTPTVLKKHPVITATVQYYDGDNVQQTLDAASYYLILMGEHRRISAVDSWPTTYDRPDAVLITMACGMSVVPPTIKQANLMLCASWNELREAELPSSTHLTKLGIDRLLFPYKRSLLA